MKEREMKTYNEVYGKRKSKRVKKVERGRG